MPPPPRGPIICGGQSAPLDSTLRTFFDDTGATIYAWPSRGGVIILDPALPVDFDFLHLDPLDPPPNRLDDQNAEDAFCQRLLLLGAKWWDSEARFATVYSIQMGGDGGGARLDDYDRVSNGMIKIKEQPPPTMREKRLVRVGWPESGGLWVAEFDTTWAGIDEEDNLCEEADIGRVAMCRTMEERCKVLSDKFGAKFYGSLDEYEGFTFLKAWEWKKTGEAGNLLTPEETVQQWIRERNARHRLEPVYGEV